MTLNLSHTRRHRRGAPNQAHLARRRLALRSLVEVDFWAGCLRPGSHYAAELRITKRAVNRYLAEIRMAGTSTILCTQGVRGRLRTDGTRLLDRTTGMTPHMLRARRIDTEHIETGIAQIVGRSDAAVALSVEQFGTCEEVFAQLTRASGGIVPRQPNHPAFVTLDQVAHLVASGCDADTAAFRLGIGYARAGKDLIRLFESAVDVSWPYSYPSGFLLLLRVIRTAGISAPDLKTWLQTAYAVSGSDESQMGLPEGAFSRDQRDLRAIVRLIERLRGYQVYNLDRVHDALVHVGLALPAATIND